MAGVVLVALGLILWVMHHLLAGQEHHSYTSGSSPPRQVELHDGTTYWLAVPGGVAAAKKAGVDTTTLTCTAQRVGAADVPLRITVQERGTKAVDQIASFPSPLSARVHIACDGLDAVYVDNATADPSGYLLVLATIALAVGIPLLLSGLRRRGRGGRRSDVERIDPAGERPLEFERDGETHVIVAGRGDDLGAERQAGVTDTQRHLRRR